MLRAELLPFGLLDAAPDFAAVEKQLGLLESGLRLRTRGSLPRADGTLQFSIDRSSRRSQLVSAVNNVGDSRHNCSR